MTRTVLIIAALGLLYYWWSKRKAGGTINAAGEWQGYQPSRFRVVAGGRSIVPVDEK